MRCKGKNIHLSKMDGRVVRCNSCGAIIQAEMDDYFCPRCGQSLYPSRVDVGGYETRGAMPVQKGMGLLLALLVGGILLSLVPFCFEGGRSFLDTATLGIGLDKAFRAAALVSSASAGAIFLSYRCRVRWRCPDKGWALPLMPAVVPYMLLGILWIMMIALGLIVLALMLYTVARAFYVR